MYALAENDYAYLRKKTGLSQSSLSLLLEDPVDFHLLIDVICANSPLRTLAKLSFALKSRIILFQKVKSLDISLEEKIYVADAINQFYPEILYKNVIRMKPKKTGNTENQCRYFLVLYGLHAKKAGQIYNKQHLDWIEQSFYNNKQFEIGKHFAIWLRILGQIDDAKLFLNSCPNINLVPKIDYSARLNTPIECNL